MTKCDWNNEVQNMALREGVYLVESTFNRLFSFYKS
jgi:hypothetical protein